MANLPSGSADVKEHDMDDRFERHPWHLTIPRLRRYARERTSRLVWAGSYRGPLPGGRQPEDVAHAAIEKVLTGARVWDETVQPDLVIFLESVVDSEISHLVESWEHRHIRPAAALATAPDSEEPNLDPISRAPSPAAGPLETVVEGEEELRQNAFAAAFIDAVSDDPVLRRIVECIVADIVKPGEIAALLGIPISEIYNRRKQLQRRLTVFYAKRSAELTAGEQRLGWFEGGERRGK